MKNGVSTLVVEWIEITLQAENQTLRFVSTLVVEWIEIRSIFRKRPFPLCLHPRGGVD